MPADISDTWIVNINVRFTTVLIIIDVEWVGEELTVL